MTVRYNEWMLLIGHRGAAGLAEENTLEALRAGVSAGVDILEFDVRVTKDGVLILAHDPFVGRMRIKSHTLDELRTLKRIATLDEVLEEFFGTILLNIELKQVNSEQAVIAAVSKYVMHKPDWDNVLFSSFKPRILMQLRESCPYANLALLHHVNPFLFLRFHTTLHLTAVGFHRLHANPLAVAMAKRIGMFTYVYTVDRPQAAIRFARRGLDGVVTNKPDRIKSALYDEA